MCGRFDRHSELETFADLVKGLTLDGAPAVAPGYNIAPSRPAAAIVVDALGKRRFEAPTWGFVPAWSSKPKMNRPINARVESVADKPMFRAAFKRNRCLVPCDGYYEWSATGAGRQPYYFTAADGGPLLIAAIHDTNTRLDARPLHTFCLLTREASTTVRDLHHRMPLLLAGDAAEAWLTPETPRTELVHLMHSGGLDFPAFHAVDRLVNNPLNDTSRCIEPLAGS